MIKLDWEEFCEMTLEERRSYFIKQHPNYEKLEKVLFAIGGGRLIYEPEMDEELCDKLIKEGKVNKKKFKLIGNEDTQNMCHAASVAIAKRLSLTCYTGYSLSKDGYWRNHSWVGMKNKFMETTPIARVSYFGISLDQQ